MTRNKHVPAYVRERGPLQTPLRVVRLADALATLQHESAWATGDRAGRTLVKQGLLRVVVTAMHAGTRLDEHQTAGALTLQCLTGQLALHTAIAHPLELIEGEFIALDCGMVHSVEAVTDCAFLLTVAQ